MAYDRYDRGDDRPRWRDESSSGRSERDWRGSEDSGRRDERGFFERAGDQISSWFGDDDAERHHSDDQRRDQPTDRFSGHGREQHRDRDRNENRDLFARGGSSERDYNRGWMSSGSGSRDRDDGRRERARSTQRDRSEYRPMAGDYGRHESDDFSARSEYSRGGRGASDYGRPRDRSDSLWSRDEYRSTSRAGTSDKSDQSRHGSDPHYHSWRDRHMSELDRDYEEYRRGHQSKFESEFGSWRERRQQKRGLLSQIREHMEVVGNDDQHVGTVDKVAGDRVILTKSDPESGGAHHSLSCSNIDRVEENRVFLDCSADQARKNWRDESRSRALFEREDQGEMGPRVLDRSFEGTYR